MRFLWTDEFHEENSTVELENCESPRKAAKSGENQNPLRIIRLQRYEKICKAVKAIFLDLEDRCSIH